MRAVRLTMFCRYLSFSFVILLACFTDGETQTALTGGRGILRVQSAQTVQQGSWLVNSFFSTYLKSEAGSSSLLYDNTWNIGITYGWSDKLELSVHLTPYQDDQQHSYAPPGHSTIALKWQTPFSGRQFQTGLQAAFRLPTTKYHNVPFEPYSSDNIAWGIKWLSSFLTGEATPLRINANIGYLDHDIGTFLEKGSTDQLTFGIGLKVAASKTIFYSEFSGEVFTNIETPSFRNNSLRLTHGFKFRVPLDLNLDLGADIGLSKSAQIDVPPIHEYAKWRVFAGLSYHFVPKRYLKGVASAGQQKTEVDDEALKRLRDRRESVGEELDDLLEKLEDESKKKEEQ